jgi:hypothetical protein
MPPFIHVRTFGVGQLTVTCTILSALVSTTECALQGEMDNIADTPAQIAPSKLCRRALPGASADVCQFICRMMSYTARHAEA